MIDFNRLKDIYEKELGFPLFLEEGEALGFYREHNDIVQPICGIYHVNPTPITAIRTPFFAVTSVDISVLAPPDRWEEVRNKMDTVAADLNGTSFEMEVEVDDAFKTFSIAYNCQTSNVADHIRDVALGVGEVFYIHQTISYIIAEGGVSAYDTKLWIDGKTVPFLTIIENRIHTTSVYPSNKGTAQTASEMETYGIEFTAPYTNDALFETLRQELNDGSNNAHCVMIQKNGKQSCKIMQVANISNTIQPPQFIGFNVSLTEVAPLSADFDGTWAIKEITNPYATLDLAELYRNEGKKILSVTVFWGDGTAERFEDMTERHVHLYADEIPTHTVMVKMELSDNMVSIARANTSIFGCEILFSDGLYIMDHHYGNDIVSNGLEGEEKKSISIVNNNSYMQYIGDFGVSFGRGDYIDAGTRLQCFVDYPTNRSYWADQYIKIDRSCLKPFTIQEE